MELLDTDDAIELWREGREVWNAWVLDNPEASVSFAGADFSKFGKVDFSSFRFPNGSVIFDSVRFGDGKVFFNNVQFGNGDVSFRFAKFGDGDVSFSEAIFGKGEVSFAEAKFGDGGISFYRVKFGDGDVSFHSTQFGDGAVSFYYAQFGDGDVSFLDAQFGDGDVSFINSRFGHGPVSFSEARFGEGSVSFVNSRFGDGNVVFINSQFGAGKVSFSGAHFDGSIGFAPGDGSEKIDELSFANCMFREAVTFLGSFTCIPDLRGTALAAHINLDYLRIEPAAPKNDTDVITRTNAAPNAYETRRQLEINEAISLVLSALRTLEPWNRVDRTKKEDTGKYRRLKELAEGAKHHEAALRFFALERRALRASGEIGTAARALDWCYEKLSNYGQSIWRPAVVLAALTVLSAFVFWAFADAKPSAAAFAALADSVPFLPTSRAINVDQATQALDGGWVRSWRLFHQFASFVLLFLIGVGLRNRFRL
ncbi:MAG: hypothetical protein QNJ84_07860 [Alphaproteobacteria bacterium]|nr:hypothetical protein [Alphaproteobacteria bacterium]